MKRTWRGKRRLRLLHGIGRPVLYFSPTQRRCFCPFKYNRPPAAAAEEACGSPRSFVARSLNMGPLCTTKVFPALAKYKRPSGVVMGLDATDTPSRRFA